MRIRQSILAVSIAIVAILAGALSVAAQNSHYNLRMDNNTGFSFYQVRLSSVHDGSWNRDLLASSIFDDGTPFTIPHISPGRYDLLLVDASGASCEVRGFRVYENRTVNVTLS